VVREERSSDFAFGEKSPKKGNTLFLKTEYSVANSLFLRKKKIAKKKRQKTSLLAMVSPQLCLQLSEFLEINSPVK
jgi:hypothetical protein